MYSAENVDNVSQQKINYNTYTARKFAFRNPLFTIPLPLLCLFLLCILPHSERENTSLYHLALS